MKFSVRRRITSPEIFLRKAVSHVNWGITIPFDGISLRDCNVLLATIADAGYTDVWSSEVNAADAFTPLAAAAVAQPGLRLGTAIVSAFTRSPALIAMSAASLADLASQQVLLGVGASSDVIVERWNGIPFRAPYARVRDVVMFVNAAFDGEAVSMETESFTISGFRLGRVPERRPKVLIAALRPGMLRLAGRISDGVILNWLSAADVAKVVPHVAEGRAEDPEVAARLFVVCSEDTAAVRTYAKRAITAYLNVEVYARFHEWLGRGSQLEPMWSAWASRDRKAALAAVPDSLVDELFIYGSPQECRRRVGEYVTNGVTTPVLSLINLDGTLSDWIRELGPVRNETLAGSEHI
jgi:probable F420-dependent oxidoreductase